MGTLKNVCTAMKQVFRKAYNLTSRANAGNETSRPKQSIASLSSSGQNRAIITFLNWDDTLFPVSALREKYGQNLENISIEAAIELRSFEDAALGLVRAAQSCGVVVIITAAEMDWVTVGASTCLPRLAEYMENNMIRFFSTFDHIKDAEVTTLSIKKEIAYQTMASYLCPEDTPLHLISIGDQVGDRNAARHVGLIREKCLTKIVSLAEYPSLDLLQSELLWLQRNLDMIVSLDSGIEFNYRPERGFVPVRRLPIGR